MVFKYVFLRINFTENYGLTCYGKSSILHNERLHFQAPPLNLTINESLMQLV